MAEPRPYHRIIPVDLTRHEYVELRPISDLHQGARSVNEDQVRAWRDWFIDHPERYWWGNGDLFDTPTKGSPTSVWGITFRRGHAVFTGNFLDWEGYPVRGGYAPNTIGTPCLRLSGRDAWGIEFKG